MASDEWKKSYFALRGWVKKTYGDMDKNKLLKPKMVEAVLKIIESAEENSFVYNMKHNDVVRTKCDGELISVAQENGVKFMCLHCQIEFKVFLNVSVTTADDPTSPFD